MSPENSSSPAMLKDVKATKIEPQGSLPTTSLEEIKANTGLWYKVHVFLHDLRRFQSDETSMSRLDVIIDPSYLDLPYFTPDEARLLRGLAVDGDTTLGKALEKKLETRLERRMKKRIESGDFRVCAAHDLAPIFEKAFQVNPKSLDRDDDFLELVRKKGLKLDDGHHWTGLAKYSLHQAKKGKRKKR